MTSRERVLACLRGERVDRAPLDFQANQSVVKRLCKRLGCADAEELLAALDVDLRRTAGPICTVDFLKTYPEGYRTNLWGVRARPGESFYGATAIAPLAAAETVDEIHAHPWPDPDILDFSPVTESCRRHQEKYATHGGWWSPFYHVASALIGFERFLIGMHEFPDVIHALIGHVVDFEVEVTRRYLEAAQGRLDIVYVGNDFGTQNALMISVEMFERFMGPALRRYYEAARDYGAKVMQHSCGAVGAIIPQLIELGMDILDPVQVAANGMEFEKLVNRFEGRLAFHGAIDTQHLLPNASPEKVADTVRSYVRIAEGRVPYIVCGSQIYTDDIPTENLLAIYETVSGDKR